MEILPSFLVRMSGFSFERLSQLAFSDTVAQLADHAKRRAELAREAEALADAIEGTMRKESKKLRYYARELHVFPDAILSRIDHPNVARVREAHDRSIAAERALEETFERELSRAREQLRLELANDEQLREAVFLESPDAHRAVVRLSPGPRTSKVKRVENTAVMYLQRFAAKNDTNSICGPFGMARFFDEPRSGTLAITCEIARRRTYLSHWAAHALIGERRVRRNPAARIEGDAIQLCKIEHDATTFMRRSHQRARLDPSLRAIWEATAEPKSASELGLEEEDLDVLVDAGVLIEGSIPFGLFDPLPDAPEEIRTHRDAFASGDLSTRIESLAQLEASFERITGASARRAGGRHYADRSLLHEDCFSEIDADLGRETTGALSIALDGLLRAAVLPMERVRARVREWFRDRFGEERFISALEVHRAFDRDLPHEAAGTTPEIEKVRAIIGDAVRAGTPIDPEVLRSSLPPLRPGYASADVMMLPPNAERRFILGEMHGFFLLVTSWFDVAPEPLRERALHDLRAALERLSGGRRTAEAIFAHTQATDRRWPIADVDLEMIGKSPRRGAMTFGELELALIDGRIEFRGGDGKPVVPFMAHGGYPFFTYLAPLAPLIDEFRGKFFPSELLPDELRDKDAPRLSTGDVVFRRATWTRASRAIASMFEVKRDVDLFGRAQQLRESLGCPRFVFAAIPGEPKPILVDFESFLLVEVFAKRVRQSDPDGQVRLSEMLPAPEDLFLRGADGPRTFELRIGVWSRG